MLTVSDLATLAPNAPYWVAAVVAPVRDWAGAPGCRRGARFLIDPVECRPARDRFAAFDSRAECLRWVMAHRIAIEAHAPDAHVAAVRLDRWMLGMETT